MRDHWSLVLFTLLVQTAVGSVWCLQAALWGDLGRMDPHHITRLLFPAACLALVGLSGAFLHLGKTANSYHAVRNLKKSWLSREITAVSVFAGSLAMILFWAYFHPGKLNARVLLVGSLTGAVALYAMTRVYGLRTVPSWNHAGTPMAFISSALLLGGLSCTLVQYLQTVLKIGSPGVLARGTYLNIVFIAVAISGLAFKFMAAGLKPRTAYASGSYLTQHPILQSGGLGLWMLYILNSGNAFLQPVLLFSASLCLITGETIHRIQFYASYKRVGL